MKEGQESLSTEELIDLKDDLVDMAARLETLANRLQVAARIPTKIVLVTDGNSREEKKRKNDR